MTASLDLASRDSRAFGETNLGGTTIRVLVGIRK